MMRLRSDGRMTEGSADHPKKGRDAEDGYDVRAAFPQQGGCNLLWFYKVNIRANHLQIDLSRIKFR